MKAARTVRPGGRWKRTRLGGHLASGLPELQHSATGQGGTFEIIICRRPATVRIAVVDAGAPSIPAPLPQGELASSGRGLALVDALARQWGQHRNRHTSVVWFEMDTR